MADAGLPEERIGMLNAPRKKESKHQAEVIAIARANGWRIDLADLHPEHRDERFFRHLEFYAPKGKVRRFVDFLFATRQHLFSLVYHTHDSRYSQPGFPDLVLVHPRRRRIVFAELKRDDEYPTIQQRVWLAALSTVAEECGVVSVAVWRPKDRETFVRVLGGIDPYAH